MLAVASWCFVEVELHHLFKNDGDGVGVVVGDLDQTVNALAGSTFDEKEIVRFLVY